MRDKTIRAIGATVVLFGVAVAAIMQIGPGEASEAISLTPDQATVVGTPASDVDSSSSAATTTFPPFDYRVGVLAGISTDNFWAFYGEQASVWNSYILGLTKPALFTLDDQGSLRPEVALGTVEPVSDETGWRVRIPMSDAHYWSDGTPVTANDVVFTFETVRALELGGSWADVFPDSIKSIHADTPTDLRIEFTQRPSLAVWPNLVGLAPIMPSHVWAGQVEDITVEDLYSLSGSEDVGGGPLALLQVTDELIVSVANPGYPGGIGPNTVEYHIFANDEAALEALKAGEVDTILNPNGLSPAQVKLLSRDPSLTVSASPSSGVRYLGFNLTREPMNDISFRVALALLLDRDALADEVNSGGGAAYTFMSSANIAWFDETAAAETTSLYADEAATRLERALEGLRDSGYAWKKEPTVGPNDKLVRGVGLTIGGREPAPLTILTSGDAYDPVRPIYATEIADTLGYLGFDVRPVETDFDTVVDLAFTPGDDGNLHYDMYLLGWTLGSPLLPSYYRPLFSEDGPENNTGYASPDFEALLAKYEAAHTIDEAREALWEMEMRIAIDLPYLLLYRPEIIEVYRSDRVTFATTPGLGGLQGLLGGITQVMPVS